MVLLLAAFICATSLAGIGAQPPTGGNPVAAQLKNPVEKTPDSIAAGRKVFQRTCVRCHGPNAKGDGGGAGGGGIPSDLTDDVWDHGSTDGEMFTTIHDGTSIDMEGYAGQITDIDIWNIVNYLRSIGPQKRDVAALSHFWRGTTYAISHPDTDDPRLHAWGLGHHLFGRLRADGQPGPPEQCPERAPELAADERRLRLDALFQTHPD